MDNYRTQSTRFYCLKLGAIVKTSSRSLVLRGGVLDKAAIEVGISFDCEQKFKCGICRESCKLISFNWKECINPQCIHSRINDAEVPEMVSKKQSRSATTASQ